MKFLNGKGRGANKKGTVFLVGGGPGDPGLLTIKGLACLTRSDVVVYDALVNPKLLDSVPVDSKRIFVGKRRNYHAFEQKQIHALLAKHAEAGKTVCRLKGGDPFLFGRGGEEAEFLATRGIPFEIIPGVSSFHGVPAAAGIPLTHRDYASFVTIATGHEKSDQEKTELWMKYDPKKTLAILMGFSRLRPIVRQLIRAGWPKSCPIAVICAGTLPNQKVLEGKLSNIVGQVQKVKNSLPSPAMIVVGRVVGLREKIVSKTKR